MAFIGTHSVARVAKMGGWLRCILLVAWLAAGSVPLSVPSMGMAMSPVRSLPVGRASHVSTISPSEIAAVLATSPAPTPLPTRTSTVHSVETSVTLEVWGCLSPELSRVLGDATLLATLQRQELLLPLEDLLTRRELGELVTPARVTATRDNQLWGPADMLGFHLPLYYRHDRVAVPPADVAALTALARSLTEPPER